VYAVWTVTFEDDSSGVFSRSVVVVFVRLRPKGAGPTRVTVEVVAEVEARVEESYLGGLWRAKGRVTFP
jgi:hypothetical protein